MKDKSINIQIGSGSIGLGTLLTVVFIVLKLCGVIDWKWIWVIAPFWISLCLGLLLTIIMLIIFFIINKKL